MQVKYLSGCSHQFIITDQNITDRRQRPNEIENDGILPSPISRMTQKKHMRILNVKTVSQHTDQLLILHAGETVQAPPDA